MHVFILPILFHWNFQTLYTSSYLLSRFTALVSLTVKNTTVERSSRGCSASNTRQT